MNKHKNQYPIDFSDDEIIEAIRGDLDSLQRVTSTQVQVQKSAKIQIGMNELQKRLNEKAYETSVMSARSANKWTKRAYCLSLIATLAATVASFAAIGAVVFNLLDYYGDRVWRTEQLQAIKEIRDRMPAIKTD